MTAGSTIRVSCFVAVMIISFSLGFGTAPGRISAATLTVARVNPGPASLNGYITCLWHGTSSPCGTAGDLQALDWSNSSAVHFRTWAFRGAGTGTAYYATKSINNSACLRVRVRLEYPIGTWRGDELYTHTSLFGTDGYTYAITGSTSYQYTSHTIGTSVAPYPNGDLSTCTSSGIHLHQGADGASRNTGTYSSTGSYSDISANSRWQHEWSWYN